MLREAIASTKGLKIGFIYGSVARGEEGAASDVDLMLVGSLSTMDISPKLRAVEKAVGRQINPTVFSRYEFAKSLMQKNHFLRTVMRNKKIMLVGTEDELEAVARGAQSTHAPDEQKLMRHAQVSTTMNVYGNALMESKREANTAVVSKILRRS